jgi:hypothetical protein
MNRRFFLLTLLAPLALRADKPQQAPHSYRIESPNKKFLAFVDATTNRTTIFERRGSNTVKLWEFPGWHANVFIADTGHHLVLGNDEGGMLPLNYDKDQTVLSFYNENVLLRKIALSEVIVNRSRLESSASHVYWGRLIGFDSQDRFWIETVERRMAFDVTGAKIG